MSIQASHNKENMENGDRLSILHSPLSIMEEIAGFIRYYGLHNKPDGYSDQLLQDLKAIQEKDFDRFTPDGNMEPSQALLLTFLEQLQEVSEKFNHRWNGLPHWYINEILRVKAPRISPDFTWVCFSKNGATDIFIPRKTAFSHSQSDSENRILYRLTNDVTVSGVEVERLYSLNFEHHPNISPAKELGCPTSLQMKNLLNETPSGPMLFETSKDFSVVQPLGLLLTSPALLLREGKRIVSIIFETEKLSLSFSQKRCLVRIRQKIQSEEFRTIKINNKNASGILFSKLISHIFFLEISTAETWMSISKYALQKCGDAQKNGFMLKFELPESFPAATSCCSAIHQIDTGFPALRILLNHDAWLFPYAWIKNLMITKITIETDVQNVSNILFYNDLGQVDISKPFAPFGMNTERRTHFILGSYEMAVKNVQAASVHICWQQLPDCIGGLAKYYEAYTNENIDNTSFQVLSYYLHDYQWKKTNGKNTHYLFDTLIRKEDNPLPRHQLSNESCLKEISLEAMNPVFVSEEEYTFSLQTKSGFVSFALESPAMGFGEKKYRQLFQDSIFEKAMKKKHVQVPNPPISPTIERLKISYTSHDEINLQERSTTGNHLYHLYPFGAMPIYPSKELKPLPFVFSMPSDANILLGLKNVKGDEYINLFFDFYPHKNEISQEEFPIVSWYWGNGFTWELLPDDALKDYTRNLLLNGLVRIYIPGFRENEKKDENGLLWLCAGIIKNAASVASVKKIYTNAAKLIREHTQTEWNRPSDFMIDSATKSLAGISKIKQIMPFSKGTEKESQQAKLKRVSEYVSHRGRAVTKRDYERLILQAFPEIRKAKCLSHSCKNKKSEKTIVSVIIVPFPTCDEDMLQPKASPQLLLKVEAFFQKRISGNVSIDAINPVYEEIMVRCIVDYEKLSYNRAYVRSRVTQVVNRIIAPWQRQALTPDFDYSFSIRDLMEQIKKIKLLKNIHSITVIQLSPQANQQFTVKEYSSENNIDEPIKPLQPHAVLVPAKEHWIKNTMDRFGVDEMEINENFVIWPKETVKR